MLRFMHAVCCPDLWKQLQAKLESYTRQKSEFSKLLMSPKWKARGERGLQRWKEAGRISSRC